MAVLDVTAAIDLLATGTYTLVRRVPGAIDSDTGLVGDPTETEVEITAVILPEPSLADDEQRSRGGQWSTDRIMVWAKSSDLEASGGELTVSNTDRLADRIEYRGKIYEGTDSLGWTEAGGYSQQRFGIVEPGIE